MFTRNILFLFLISLALSCGEKKEAVVTADETANNFIEVTQAQFNQIGMELGSVEAKNLPELVEANGMIDVPPQNRAMITPVMGGYVTYTPLLVGDEVRKGQLLVRLENPEYIKLQQEYLEVFEQLAFLKNSFERQQILHEEQISSEKQLLKSESDYKSAQARYTGLQKQLRLLNISSTEVEKGNIQTSVALFAPISGSITKVNSTVGMFAAPASPLMEIVDNDHIHLELSVFEKDILKVEKGQKIHFRIPEASDEVYEAEVHLVGRSLDENRTVKVHGHLNEEDKQTFLPGMYVSASIEISEKTMPALPETAVVEIENRYSVLLLDHQEGDTYFFKEVEVTPGNSELGYTQIENADTLGAAQVLVKGAFELIGL